MRVCNHMSSSKYKLAWAQVSTICRKFKKPVQVGHEQYEAWQSGVGLNSFLAFHCGCYRALSIEVSAFHSVVFGLVGPFWTHLAPHAIPGIHSLVNGVIPDCECLSSWGSEDIHSLVIGSMTNHIWWTFCAKTVLMANIAEQRPSCCLYVCGCHTSMFLCHMTLTDDCALC